MKKTFTLALSLPVVVGCAVTPPHRHGLDQRGIIYYLDGAGGGPGPFGEWGESVQRGFSMAGFEGDFVSFRWHTGFGAVFDQLAGVEYKRAKAKTLAAIISEYVHDHPNRPVHLVGMSAGTVVTAFTLEALAEELQVDTVVFLGSSLSAHYDMGDALERVRDKLYVFTSSKDGVLSFLVPLSGTADRKYCGMCAVGLKGLHAPQRAGPKKKKLYAKVENVNWRTEFETSGHLGGHTGSVSARFVRDYVAPLLLRNGPRFVNAGRQPPAIQSTSDLATHSVEE